LIQCHAVTRISLDTKVSLEGKLLEQATQNHVGNEAFNEVATKPGYLKNNHLSKGKHNTALRNPWVSFPKKNYENSSNPSQRKRRKLC